MRDQAVAQHLQQLHQDQQHHHGDQGHVGSGGLGDLALREGYQRNRTDVALVTVVVLLILVQLLQMLGDRLVAHYSRK